MSMFALQRVVGWLEKLKIMSTQLLNDLLQSVTGETMLWSIKKEKWITGKVMSIVHKLYFTLQLYNMHSLTLPNKIFFEAFG